MASTTVHNFPSDGSIVARGTASVADGDTVATGLSAIDGFVGVSASADTVVSLRSGSAGTATVGVFTAGVASAGTRTIYWEAWNKSQRV